MELVAGNSPLPPTPGDSRPRDSYPLQARRTGLHPRSSSALGCSVGRVVIPTTGIESESLDAESRLCAQTT